MTYTSYHNHTTWSDGSSGIAEMIDAGRRAGLRELGISDHYVLAPGNPGISWAIAPDSLDAYVAEIGEAIAKTGDMTVRMGLEIDYFPETIGETARRVAACPFDYLIGSVHFVEDFPIDFEARAWEALAPEVRDMMWRGYWRRLRDTARTRLFDIIGHFDLPKKFNFHASIDLTAEALEALDAVAEADMTIEINTSGWDRPAAEAYPSLFYLQEAKRRGIPLVINADAHKPEEVVRHYERAKELAMAAGYSELVRFKGRRRFSYPLSSWAPCHP